MQRLLLDRRQFLAGLVGAAGAASLPLPALSAPVPDDLTLWLQETVAATPELRAPDLTGAPADAVTSALLKAGEGMTRAWGLDPFIPDWRTAISSVLVPAKCQERPSYLTEYAAIAADIEWLATRLGGHASAINILSFAVFPEPIAAVARLGRYRAFILHEFARFLIAQGGFRRFAPLQNYAGFMGGPFTGPDLPYRGLGR